MSLIGYLKSELVIIYFVNHVIGVKYSPTLLIYNFWQGIKSGLALRGCKQLYRAGPSKFGGPKYIFLFVQYMKNIQYILNICKHIRILIFLKH